MLMLMLITNETSGFKFVFISLNHWQGFIPTLAKLFLLPNPKTFSQHLELKGCVR